MSEWMTIPASPRHQDMNILGPVVLPNRVTGAVYHRFLVNDLPVLLKHVPVHQRQHRGFMHDGAPPHFSAMSDST
jgi:hypothetical protein